MCDLELLNICNDAFKKFHSSQKDLNIYKESFVSIPSSVLKILYKEKKLTIPYRSSEIKINRELYDLQNSYKNLEVELERNKEINKNLEVELEGNKESNKDLELELERKKEDLLVIQNTLSWKLTYPIRYSKKIINSLFKKL